MKEQCIQLVKMYESIVQWVDSCKELRLCFMKGIRYCLSHWLNTSRYWHKIAEVLDSNQKLCRSPEQSSTCKVGGWTWPDNCNGLCSGYVVPWTWNRYLRNTHFHVIFDLKIASFEVIYVGIVISSNDILWWKISNTYIIKDIHYQISYILFFIY